MKISNSIILSNGEEMECSNNSCKCRKEEFATRNFYGVKVGDPYRRKEVISFGNGTIFQLMGTVNACGMEYMQNYISKEVSLRLSKEGYGSVGFFLPPQNLCTICVINQSQEPIYVKRYVSPNLQNQKEIVGCNHRIETMEMEIYPIAIFLQYVIIEVEGCSKANIKIYMQGLK